VVAELAKACPSTAWVVSIINSCVWLASAMSFEMQDYIFPDPKNPPRVCSPTNGSGTLVPEGDHWVLNGKWSYGSGSHHSKFALVPAESPSGAGNFVAVPLADVELINTWKVSGMKGTGSDTVVANNVRIERHQFTEIAGVGDTVSLHVSSNGLSPDARKAQLIEATDHWIGLTLLRSKTLAIVLGVVQGLFEVVVKTREKGIMFTSYDHRGDSQVWQTGVGRCHAKLLTVESILKAACRINEGAALEGRALSEAEKISSRAQVIVGIKLLDETTKELMDLCGTAGFAEFSPAQRFMRDFDIGSRHAMFAADPGFETVGKWVLGIEPNITPPTLY
jgi:alkylation response protein AidB-like acyl-CoA dehydrogenase